MPELPEVEWMRRVALPVVGARLTGAHAHDPRIPPLDAVVGRCLVAVERRGKTLIFDFGAVVLVLEPRMTGRLLPAGAEARHLRLRLDFAAPAPALQLDDPRRLAVLRVVEADQVDAAVSVRPEPWPERLDGAGLAGAFSGARGGLKAALLDQRWLRGVGNIGAAEGCWRAGIDPGRALSGLSAAEWDALAAGLHGWAAAALAALGDGPLTLLHAGGDNPFAVYGRAGAPCPRCGAPVARRVDGGRSTYWCPGCQS